MSYNLPRYELQLISSGDANSTATQGSRSVGIRPFLVQRCAVLVAATLSGTFLVVTFSKRATPGTASGGTTIGTITVPTGASAGTLYILDLVTGVACDYGDQVHAAVTTAIGTSGNIDALVDVEDLPSNPRASIAVTFVTS